jgi:hypothetical protein
VLGGVANALADEEASFVVVVEVGEELVSVGIRLVLFRQEENA